MNQPDFSRIEEEFIRAFYVRSGRSRRNFADHFAYLDDWTSDLGNGFGLDSSDWTNSISTRHVLWELTSQAPPGLKAKLDALLRPIDDRFIAATQPCKRDLPWTSTYEPRAWSSRVPLRILDPDFEAFLRSKGYLSSRQS